jgi:ATP-dependent helicase/nuclease subunit A
MSDKNITFTDAQVAALRTNLNIAVTAGAGTGKTHILVERYLKILLEQDVDIRSVLAITFTDKAAAEMLTRVAKRVGDMLDDPEYQRHRTRLENIRDRLSSAVISTIHSFGSRILREYPVEAGLDPDFMTLLGDPSSQMRDEALEEVLEELDGETADWLPLFRFFGEQNLRAMLEKALASRYELETVRAVLEGRTVDELYQALQKQVFEQLDAKLDIGLNARVVGVAVKILSEDTPAVRQNKKASKITEILNVLERERDRDSAEHWRTLADLAKELTKSGTHDPHTEIRYLGGKGSWSQIQCELILDIAVDLSDFLRVWNELGLSIPGERDRQHLELLPKFYLLYDRFRARYSEKKAAVAGIDFDDMQILALKLLKNNESARTALAAQYKYIMVDEFQDTNSMQWELISLLGELAGNKFFVVGDPKQSIYGFRNADVRVFESVKKQFAESGSGEADYEGNVVFPESFRFKEGISDFVNFAFSRILRRGSEEKDKWEVGYDLVKPVRKDRDGGEVELALFVKKEQIHTQEEFLANHIEMMIAEKGKKPGDIAILLRSRTELAEIEEQLRRKNIPFKTIGGVGFYQRQEIYDVYHLMLFLLDPHDNIAALGLLRSPMVLLSDETIYLLSADEGDGSFWDKCQTADSNAHLPEAEKQKVLQFVVMARKWLARRERIEYSTLLAEIFDETNYRALLAAELNGEQHLANLDKILASAEEFESRRLVAVNEFVESLKRLINEEVQEGDAPVDVTDATTVKIMTIHKSKGLEFPVVILPYLNSTTQTSAREGALFSERWGIVGRNYKLPDEKNYSALYHLQKAEDRRKELAELKRLFYVGCTRARDHLVLSGYVDEKAKKGTSLALLESALPVERLFDLEEGAWEYGGRKTINVIRGYADSGGKADEKLANVIRSAKAVAGVLERGGDSGSEIPVLMQTVPDTPNGEVFSATQLMTFAQDPEVYLERYHLGYFRDDYDRDAGGSGESDIAMLRGKIIHRFMEYEGKADPKDLLFEFEIFDPKEAAEIVSEIEQLREQIAGSEYLQAVLAAKARNEIAITMRLGEDFLTGTLDRLYRDTEGNWCVIDYKSNRVTEATVDTAARKYGMQVKTYALLLSALYPGQNEYRVALYFTRIGAKRESVFSPDDVRELHSEFSAIVAEIRTRFLNKLSEV